MSISTSRCVGKLAPPPFAGVHSVRSATSSPSVEGSNGTASTVSFWSFRTRSLTMIAT
jgi:hypothetical protein